ncbi:MAG: SDR family oxidoreductase [Clostridia bacterium]|nr:SDR family oxidoreductase [Clostridia bacterium]
MGIYAVTGGSSGIGAKTAELLRAQGNTVYDIDIKNADIFGDLSSPEGRQNVIDALHEKCPDGLDGLVCCAGVSNSCGNLKLILSLNYFGVVTLASGVFDLLKKKRGACVVISSNTISSGAARMDVVDFLNNHEDENRSRKLVENLDPMRDGHSIYVATKYALVRWMRRVSAQWAADGVRINAVAPGNVATAMTARMTPQEWNATMALPIPTMYGKEALMDPTDIAEAIIFLVSSKGHGVNGICLFADGGTDALLNSEKVY